MPPLDAPRQFPLAMKAIHWSTAALMVAVFALVWAIPNGPGDGGLLLQLHKSIGLTLLVLTALRLILRNTSDLPTEDSGIAWVEAAGARLIHVLLYIILFAMPVSGYLAEAAKGHVVSVFGLVDIPALVPASATLRQVAWSIHETGQLAVYLAVGLHVLAALFHVVVRRDGVMARMLPSISRRHASVGSASLPAAE